MKYGDLIQFKPIVDVIQVGQLSNSDYCENVIKTFVYPDYFIDTILPTMIHNVDFTQSNRKGMQIIGNYGTGKSHLMSLVSLIAENDAYLQYIEHDNIKHMFASIAGKYNVLRFELGNQDSLWKVVTFQLQRYLTRLGIDFEFAIESPKTYTEQLGDMMATYEEHYPNKGLMLMIDEMLSYLKGRAAMGMLAQDLPVLQALGQCCSNGHFAFMYGVQELIYQAPEFQNLAAMLLQVKDRYVDLTIRKEEVAFIVHDRLLRKSEQQKSAIREHLEPYRKFFSGLNAHFEDYVDLFPVHPSYFDNFQRIRIGRSQREVLRTLSSQFNLIKDNEIPTDNPGLITYDSYWEFLMDNVGMQAIPDFKTVLDTVRIIHGKIDDNFTGLRAARKPLAKRIVNATAIKILQDSLNKNNGATAETLVEELCLLLPMADDKDFLIDSVANCAEFVIQATSGQYYDKSDNAEYHLRTEGGINVDQIIKQQADTMSDAQKDAAYFAWLVEALGIEINQYRTGFRIYQHELIWASHKVARDGYLFFGNSAEKSTTQPKQYFYMMFMPIFQTVVRSNDDDELYFDMSKVSEEFKTLVCLHGAASNMVGASDSSQKPLYQAKRDELFRKTRTAFDQCYLNITEVIYKNQTKALTSFSLPPQGATKMEIFDSVASALLDKTFLEQTPHYPSFTQVNQPITHDNISRYIKGAYLKLNTPNASNIDGQAVLTALGLYSNGTINADDSIYAQNILRMMGSRVNATVINRDELLEALPHSNETIWRSKDFQIDAAFEFIVLAALVYLGELEIVLNGGKALNASNLQELNSLSNNDTFLFSCVRRPQGLKLPVIRAITQGLCGTDLSGRLDDSDTYVTLVTKAREQAQDAARAIATKLQSPLAVAGIVLYDEQQTRALRLDVQKYKEFCDRLTTFTTQARLRNLNYETGEIQQFLSTKKKLEDFEKLFSIAKGLENEVNYLNQALQYTAYGSSIYNTLTSVTEKISLVLQNHSEPSIRAYQDEILSAKNAYIDYYMRLYNSYCISDIDENKRQAILNSSYYVVAQELTQCTILNAAQWNTWRADFVQLKTANPQARTILESTPYVAPFNPLVNNKPLPSVLQMEANLADVYNSYIEQLKQFVASDESQTALSMMDDAARNYASGFISGLRIVQTKYEAVTLVEFINTLTNGFVHVEITSEGLSRYFNRAMTVDEAKGAFANYLQNLTSGQPQSKIRITLNLD